MAFPTWILSNVDNPTKSTPITGQFDPKLQRGIGGPKWQIKPGILGAPAWLKFVSKGVPGLSFEFLYIAETITDRRPGSALQLLERFADLDETLGRPPRVLFTYGKTIIEAYITGIPESIPILFWGDGRNQNIGRIARQIGPFRVTLHEIARPVAEVSSFTNFVTKTEETTFEMLARRQYGNARYAQTLAIHNQGVEIGKIIEIPRKRSGLVSKVTPISSYLDDTTEGT